MTQCKLCGAKTVECLPDRPDYEYGVPQKLNYLRCTACKLVFASPSPTPREVQSFYKQYSTHKQARLTVLGRMARRKTLRETCDAIGDDKNVRILDYGCGNGSFLKDLETAGYRNLSGYDFDPNAVAAANCLGMKATADIAELIGPYDVITLNHVIEHFIDPVEELKTLAGYLAPSGKVVIRTPNDRSLTARLSGDGWRGWETPRHLNIMNKIALPEFIRRAEMDTSRCYNSKAMFFGMFHESFRGKVWATLPGKLFRHFVSFLIWPIPGGEETVAVARKRA